MVKIYLNKKVRRFKVGLKKDITLKDVGNLKLNNNELITFKFEKKIMILLKKIGAFIFHNLLILESKKQALKLH